MQTFNDYSYFSLHRTPYNGILTSLPSNTTAALSYLLTSTSRNPWAIYHQLHQDSTIRCHPLSSSMLTQWVAWKNLPIEMKKKKKIASSFDDIARGNWTLEVVTSTYKNKSNYWVCCMPSFIPLCSPSQSICSSACWVKYMGWICTANAHSTALKVDFLIN